MLGSKSFNDSKYQSTANKDMFECDFDVKFPLLRLLQIVSDSKSTIQRQSSSISLTNYNLQRIITRKKNPRNFFFFFMEKRCVSCL